MKNPTVKRTVRVVTIAGSAVLVVGAAMNLLSAKSLKDAAMPVVAILVGVLGGQNVHNLIIIGLLGFLVYKSVKK